MSTDNPFRVGVWLELSRQPLLGEGIFRLLATLMKACCQRDDVRVVLAAPSWGREPLERLLSDQQIPRSAMEIMTSREQVPVAVRLVQALARRKPPANRGRIRRLALHALKRVWHSRLVAWAVLPLLATTSPVVVALALVAACILPVLAGYLGRAYLGQLLIGVSLLALPGLAVLIWKMVAAYIRSPLQQAAHYLRATLDSVRTSWRHVFAVLYASVLDYEYRLLARKASQRADIAVWFVPHPRYAHARLLAGPLVVAVPDTVYVDFPVAFAPHQVLEVDRLIRQLTQRADLILSYSEHVRDAHVVRYLGREKATTAVIPHAPMALNDRLEMMTKAAGGDSREAANLLITSFMRANSCQPTWTSNFPERYLLDFPFDEVPFLFVSSQPRPHKNFLNLFRAFEVLLRKRYRNLKLFLTGELERETLGLREYLLKNHLELDVISVPGLPSDVHAAFYHLAALTVVPTLFEGAFPFPFTESMSVHTPVVMSSIPATREVVPEDLARFMLFDPYDTDSIAERILWGLENREELLAREQRFYQVLLGRTWSQVAQEYLQTFCRAARAGKTTDPCLGSGARAAA
jgi:glycosyltransferase involved in cell wall biosynthesis